MIVKRNFDPRKVTMYVWRQLAVALLWSAVVYVAYVVLGLTAVSVPFGILGILGTALAIFLAFRNNTAFGRWGEASQAWTAITAASRTFARLIVTFTDSHAHTAQFNTEAATAFKREMVYRHIAWANALRMQLRGQMDVNQLAPFLDSAELAALAQELAATVSSVAEAIAFGEVVVFAIPGSAMEETIAAHAPALAGKVVVDAANRMGGGPMNSLAAFAAHAPTAQVYRAFNSLGWESFENPLFGDVQADLFYCGPASPGQNVVEGLIQDMGLRPVRLGGLDQVGLVDMISGLWFALAYGQGMGRQLAFKVLTRPQR